LHEPPLQTSRLQQTPRVESRGPLAVSREVWGASLGGHSEFQDVRRIGPLAAVAANPRQAAQRLCKLASSAPAQGSHFHLINAYTVALADRHAEYRHVLSGTSINLPDGKPLSWISRLRRDDVPLIQVRGQEFFMDVLDMGRDDGLRHFLLGSTQEVLDRLEAEVLIKFPGVAIVGSYSPPFRPMTSEEIADQDALIRASRAQVVWVGLGTPKQDYEAHRLANTLPVMTVAIGAAFDFTAGTLKEAPELMRRAGLEWLYRLASEPRRLWRRYLFGNVRFVLAALKRDSRVAAPTGPGK
jgi:N-acetylglucosaminyldiphosphoundecaprenol N-acetyl-beta-D-mannosaminyltransferase